MKGILKLTETIIVGKIKIQKNKGLALVVKLMESSQHPMLKIN